MSRPKTLALKSVSFRYEKQQANVVNEITLEISRGERIAILGESGSGKSTLLALLSGLFTPSSGRVLLQGEDISGIPFHERNIALVFQRSPVLVGTTVRELLRRPARRNGSGLDSTSEHISGFKPKGIEDVLGSLGMGELGHRRLTDLSGGELQRVHIARSLVWKPDFMLLDEPFNSIDVQLKHSIYPMIRQHQEGCGSCMILVTHDPHEALLLCHRIVVMRNGSVLADSSAEELLATPPNIGSAEMLGGFATNIVDVELTHESGTEVHMNTFLGRYCGTLDVGEAVLQLPSKVKAVFRWTDIIGQPIYDEASCRAPVFTAGNFEDASLGNPVLYMHERWVVYGRSLPNNARKATLGLAAKSTLLYDAQTERFLCRFTFSKTIDQHSEEK